MTKAFARQVPHSGEVSRRRGAKSIHFKGDMPQACINELTALPVDRKIDRELDELRKRTVV